MHERRGCLSQLLGLLGILFIVQLVLPATGLQGKLNRWLTAPEWRIEDREPAVVVVLGGGGIPSESGLIRTWYGADTYENYPHATYVVCLPAGDNPEEDSVGLMRDELVMRGVPSEQVLLETRGRNTREQASEVQKILQERGDEGPVLVVTSPYHLRRSIESFHAAGLTETYGLGASSVEAEGDLGGWLYLRYGIWGDLAHQPILIRELVALAVYKVREWMP